MARKYRTQVVGDAASSLKLTPRHMSKIEFGRRLYKLMLAKGWHPSELARQAGIAKDSVSTYLRGVSAPSPTNLRKLARVFGMTPEELSANYVESAIEDDQVPVFELKVSANAPNIAWLRINRMVSTASAFKIASILEQDNAVDGLRGGDTPKVPSDKD